MKSKLKISISFLKNFQIDKMKFNKMNEIIISTYTVKSPPLEIKKTEAQFTRKNSVKRCFRLFLHKKILNNKNTLHSKFYQYLILVVLS